MTEDSRLVRELLDANRDLTSQFIELVRLVIGAPQVQYAERAPMEETSTARVPTAFELSSADDWPDMPDTPLGKDAQIYDFIPRVDPREIQPDLPLHISEEEEDLRFEVAHELADPKSLTDFLVKLGAPSGEILIDPLA